MMKKRILAALSALIMTALTYGQTSPQSHWRPPAVPLVACDPYFSIWSFDNNLTDGPTRHWTGHPQELTSLVRIDGKTYRIMGDAPADVPAANQTSLRLTPTSTIYEFTAGGVQITLKFLTPKLPSDLMLCSWPITYITWSAQATDGKSHDVRVYLDASAMTAVNVPEQEVVEARGKAGNLKTLRVGTAEQPVLDTRGDDLRIDWGYFYLAADVPDEAILPAQQARKSFADDGVVQEMDQSRITPVPARDAAALCLSVELNSVGKDIQSYHAILAYDDLYSIRYFNDDLKPYWKKDGATINDLLQSAEKQYASITQRCEAFDNELVSDMRKIGGDSYVSLGVLAWRQALAAQKLCTDANGQPLMFSKENFSNGCISTVDVLYPAAPQMIAFSPNMLKASLVPLMDYASSSRWHHDSAPHDLGTYPQATGQVYSGGEQSNSMPVEESGNLLILFGALAKAEGNADFAQKYWPTLTTWMNYLKANGLDPENQLTTDDFAGHIARNANLSAKAIMGIASYGMLADMLGKKDDAAAATKTAKEYAQKWMEMGADGDHYRLVFGEHGNGTWSQKYNLVWDKILGLNIFPTEVAQKEEAFYQTKMNPYGLPLDSRKTYTKIDWEFWTATMAGKHEQFQSIVDACAKWANETPDRVPLSDWYDTVTGRKCGFQARSVVGGLFIPFLKDADRWHEYASRDQTKLSGWAKTDFSAPRVETVIPAADTEPAVWRYTTSEPADNWMKPDFDDSLWSKGRSGFGTPETPGTHVNTRWDTADIYIRREINIPSGEMHNLQFHIHHDEDAEIYINGVRAARPRGFVAEYVTIPISPRGREALHTGKNLIAVHCHQTTGGQYIDVGIVELVSKK
jgi:hypothetical protein